VHFLGWFRCPSADAAFSRTMQVCLSCTRFFLRTRCTTSRTSNRPDLEIMPIAHWCSDPPPYTIRNGVFSFLICVLQAKSVGSVRLAFRDPHARPTVDLGFLSDPEDPAKFRRGMTLSLRLADKVRRQGYKMKNFQAFRSRRPRRSATWTNSSGPTSAQMRTTLPPVGWPRGGRGGQ
jgi:hypothetical protein